MRRTVAVVLVALLGTVPWALSGASSPAGADGNEAPGAPAAFRELSGGGSHACAVLTDGSLKCWGLNTQGQLGLGDSANRGDGPGEMGVALPAVDLGTGRTAVEVSAGGSHTCAVLDDGSVKCWGNNNLAQLGLGDNANRGDGAGEMGNALPAVDLGTGRTAVAVSAGTDHTCAVLDDGSVKCWGRGDVGQLGLGDTDNRGDGPGEMGDALPAVDLGTGRTAVAISAGTFHTCAVLDDGSVKCWGSGGNGRLGQGATTNVGDGPGEMGDALPAVSLGTGRTATAVAAANAGTCAVLDNGSLKCWGLNTSGQLGLGDVADRGDGPGEMGDALPAVSLGTGRTAVGVSGGNAHTCAQLNTGSVKCWGAGASGRTGYGDTLDRGDGPNEMGDDLPAVALGTDRVAVAVTTAAASTCARLDTGTVKCWGQGSVGRLGLGDTADRGDGPNEMGDALPPVQLSAPPAPQPEPAASRQLSAGGSHTCAILANGSVKCWGDGALGKLGLGDTAHRGDAPGEMGGDLPTVDLGTGRTAVAIAAGLRHACAILDNGALKCWGQNAAGQLGLGDTAHRGDGPGEMGDALPAVDLGTGRTAVAVSIGLEYTCAVLDNGALKCWGANAVGQLGLGDAAQRGDGPGEMGDALPAVALGTGRTAVAVSASTGLTCALLDDGSVKCWGSGLAGALGQGSTTNLGDGPGEMGDSLPAVNVGTGRTSVAITTGAAHACAILDDGSVKCWGLSFEGGLGLGGTDARGDGPGEMGDALPAVALGTGRTAVAVDAGADHTCAVLDDATLKCWGRNVVGHLGLGDSANRGDGPGEMGDALPAVNLGTDRTPAAVSGGGAHTCVRLDDGNVKCWGYNQYGQLGLGDTANRGDGPGEMGDALPPVQLTAPPAPALSVVRTAGSSSVAVGDTIRVVVSVTNTGNVDLTGVTITDPTAPGCEVAPFSLAEGANRTVRCTHTAAVGDIPLYDATASVDSDQTAPATSNPSRVAVASRAAFRQVSTGGSHSCAIVWSGKVKCWGQNDRGQLGLGDTANRGSGPGQMGDDLPVVDLGTGRTAVAISAGTFHSCALLDDGSVKCWGFNQAGELGLGDTANRGDGAGEMGDDLPAVDLGTGRTVVAVSASQQYTCAVLDDASVKCWGSNFVGKLGLGDTANRGDGPNEMGDDLPAVALGTGRTAVAVAAGGFHACALLDNASVKCWGAGGAGALGQESTATMGDGPGEMGDALPATNVGTGRTVSALTAGTDHTCALLDNATVKCWGQSNLGQLGLGINTSKGRVAGQMGDALPAVDLGTGRTAVAVNSRFNHTCAVLDDGSAKCWGWNIGGQLGLGDADDRGNEAGEMGDDLPVVDLGTGRTAVAVAAGLTHTCARLDEGSVKCWGMSANGQLGLGDNQTRGDDPGEMGDALPVVALGTPAPGLSVAIAAEAGPVPVGDTVDYDVTVTNTGDVELTGVVVSTPGSGGCAAVTAVLSPGEDDTVACSHVATVDDVGTYAASASADSDQTESVASIQVNVAVTVPAGQALVRGTVTATIFGNPVAGALVAGLTPADYSVGGLDLTAGDGTFAMLVPAGSTHVYVADPAGGHIAAFATGSPTVVADGATVVVNAQVTRSLGGIEGRITDALSGDGVPTGLALAVNARTGQVGAAAATDASGFYVIRDLRSVSYHVTLLDLSGAHRPTYHAGASSVADATAVDVVGGALQVIGTSPVPAQAPPSGATSVQGTVTGPGGDPLEGVAVVVLSASTYGFAGGAVTDASGNYEVPVDAGNHVVGFIDTAGGHTFEWHADRPANQLGAATVVSAALGSPAEVDAVLASSRGTIAGTVTEDGSGDPIDDVWVFAIDTSGSVVGVARTAADGTYSMSGVPALPVRVRMMDLTGDHFPEYHDDLGGPGAGSDYPSATLVTVIGGTTTTIDAALAPVSPPPPPVD